MDCTRHKSSAMLRGLAVLICRCSAAGLSGSYRMSQQAQLLYSSRDQHRQTSEHCRAPLSAPQPHQNDLVD